MQRHGAGGRLSRLCLGVCGKASRRFLGTRQGNHLKEQSLVEYIILTDKTVSPHIST